MPVIGTGIAGRFCTEVVQFLLFLAWRGAAADPRLLRPALITAWVATWSWLVTIGTQRAFAASLLRLPTGRGQLHELLAQAR